MLDSDDQTPDTMCHCLNLCTVDEGYDKICHVFPLPEYAQSDPTAKCPTWTKNPVFRTLILQAVKQVKEGQVESLVSLLDKDPITQDLAEIIEEIIYNFGSLKQPIFDRDRDGFSDKSEHNLSGGLRGYWWRGLDCAGRQETTYPGRQPENDDRFQDSNCNGLSGVDSFGDSIERKYCAQYESKGIAVLGDSASAHFGIPERWMRPSEFNEKTFENLFLSLVNELDWPQLSWATGMTDNCWQDDMFSYAGEQSDSIYQRYVEWNRCALNDYQNQANNGARSTNALKLARGLSLGSLLGLYKLLTICQFRVQIVKTLTREHPKISLK